MPHFESSIVWMQDNDATDAGANGAAQGWSWPDARQSYYHALTLKTKQDREQKWADTFRAVGQVMHLIEDAASPAHVRNEARENVRQQMLRTVGIVTVTLMCMQAGAQVTPPSGTGSPASAATVPTPSATPFPKSDAVLPTGKRENRWGPFEGRVVDADTGEGIAGAAVIVHWMKAMSIFNPAIFVEGHDEFDDARWAVADKDGHFVVPRRDAPWFRFGTTKAYLTCVAPGYLPYEFSPASDPSAQAARLREGQITVRMHRIPQMTREERLSRLAELSASNLSSVPHQKLVDMARAVNAKRGSLGLAPIYLSDGELERER